MDIELLAFQFCDYCIQFKGYSKDTIRRYKTHIRQYCKYSGAIKTNDITLENVRAAFYFGRTERNWRSSSFIAFHASLMVFFKWCMQNGYLKSNPAEEIEVPRPEKQLPKKLTKEDATKLLEVIHNYPYNNTFLQHRNYAIFSTFIYAGLRKSELLNLKCTDVDINNLSIFVRQGKGKKDRVIPINYTLAHALKKYSEERNKTKKTCPEYFVSLIKNTAFTKTGLKRLSAKIIHSSKIAFTIHQLRHTFATLMLEGGCDIYSLSRMMGHSDIKTTTIYLSASVEHLRAQVAKHPLLRQL